MKIEIACKTRAPGASERVAAVQEMFGIGLSPRSIDVVRSLDIAVRGGEIILVTGPSGSGKSSILRVVKKRTVGSLDVSESDFDGDISVVDSLRCSFQRTLELLSLVGLGEAFLMLRRFDELSEGQKSRFRLAFALSKEPRLLVADEFCSTLDRLTAKVVSFNLRRIVTKTKSSAIVATANDDILSDLRPDVVVRPRGGGEWAVERKEWNFSEPISFYKNLRLKKGTLADWRKLAHFHYKSHSTGIVDRVFVLCLDGELIGVLVYAYPMGDIRLRNFATGNRYTGSGLTRAERKKLLNGEMRVVQRIVIDPRFRGLGLASAFLRSTFPLLSVRFVECLAVMGGYSRFLEKAGFACVGRVSLPKEGRLLLGELRGSGHKSRNLHDEEELHKILRKRCAKSALFGELLRRWLNVRSYAKGAKNLRRAKETDFEKAAELLCRELSSRPFYFICDVEKFCKEECNVGAGTAVIPFEGERLESEQNGRAEFQVVNQGD